MFFMFLRLFYTFSISISQVFGAKKGVFILKIDYNISDCFLSLLNYKCQNCSLYVHVSSLQWRRKSEILQTANACEQQATLFKKL